MMRLWAYIYDAFMHMICTYAAYSYICISNQRYTNTPDTYTLRACTIQVI